MLTEHVEVYVENLKPGDIIRFQGDTAWVEVVRKTRDRYGFDLLYRPFNKEPRWRGFDERDKVTLKRAAI